MKRIPLILATFSLLLTGCATAVFGFDVEGFQSGMSREDVVKVLKRSGITPQKISEMPDRIGTVDRLGNASFFDFCGERLVSMERMVPPKLRRLTLMIKDFNERYGQPIYIWAGSRLTSQFGQIDDMSILWRDGKEYISVYGGMIIGEREEIGDSLGVSYAVPNNCFKVPR